jgi:hypothetical protein
MSFKTKDLVTHYTVSGPRVLYRFARVHSVGENGLVLKDRDTDEPLQVAFEPRTTRQDFRITVERQQNLDGTRKRALELWTLDAHVRLRLRVARLIEHMSSETGLETTYPDPFFEAEPISFRDHWVKQLTIPTEPEIVNTTGTPITDSLRPWVAKR